MTLFQDFDTSLQEKYRPHINKWAAEFSTTELKALDKVFEKVEDVRKRGTIVYPNADDTLRIYRELDFAKIKVVIIAQDPYHDGNANGIAFACKNKTSKSLEQIINAIMVNYPHDSVSPDSDKSLQYLVDQGVFLMNTVLTVEKGHPNSHADMGWQAFTKATVEIIARKSINVVWLLWGKPAQEYEAVIKKATWFPESHIILKAEHPAAAARANRIWKTNCFREANLFLETFNYTPIKWI